MVDPIQEMLAAGVVPTDSLPGTSRYREVGTAMHGDDPDAVVYYRRRLVPQPDRHRLLRYVQVREGDRRDLLAHAQFGDAALWWRLADAQGVLDPALLEAPAGRWVRVTLAAGPRPHASGDGSSDDA